MIAGAIVVACCAGFGALLDRALFGGTWAGGIERLGRALLFGLGGAGAASMALDAFGVPVRLLPLVVLLAAAALPMALAIARRRAAARSAPGAEARGSPAPPGGPAPSEAAPRGAARAATWGLLLLAALSLGQVLFSGLVRPTFQFDSLTRWMLKAKVLATEGTLLGAISTDPDYAFTHQRYPPLVSHVAHLPSLVAPPAAPHAFDDRLAQSPFAWFAVALAALVHGAVLRRAGALAAALGAAWVASLPLLAYVTYPPPGAGGASAMADVPLALFATGALLAIADAVDGRRDRAHLEAGLLLGFATLTKNEGLPLVAGAALALLLFSRRGRWRAALGTAGLALALHWLLWGRLAAHFPALDEHYPGRLHLEAVREGLARLPLVLSGLGAELLRFRDWNLTWPAVALLLAVGRARRAALVLLLVVAWQLASYVFAFVITAWTSPAAEASVQGGDPVEYLMVLTAGRLVMHVAPAAIVAALIAAPALARPARRPAAARPASGVDSSAAARV